MAKRDEYLPRLKVVITNIEVVDGGYEPVVYFRGSITNESSEPFFLDEASFAAACRYTQMRGPDDSRYEVGYDGTIDGAIYNDLSINGTNTDLPNFRSWGDGLTSHYKRVNAVLIKPGLNYSMSVAFGMEGRGIVPVNNDWLRPGVDMDQPTNVNYSLERVGETVTPDKQTVREMLISGWGYTPIIWKTQDRRKR